MEPKAPQPEAGAGAPVEAAELSEREREILILVANGASNKEVALKLVISPNTVKVHLRNIFSKIGVSSRTEAALYAVRVGLVQVAAEAPAQTDVDSANGVESPAEAVAGAPAPAEPAVAAPAVAAPAAPRRLPPARWLGASALLVAAIVLVALLVVPRRLPPPAPTAVPATSVPRWQPRSAMPAVRGRLAAVTFEGQVYAIAGETDSGVTGANERYDPAADAWTQLAPKPLPVAEAGAAVLGGQIYVPGGRLASGAPTDVLEVYDPIADAWDRRAPLPLPLSGYALAAFEGRLYVFGGWNGADYVASVYEYDPGEDAWIERTRMPTARGHAAAALSGGKIYVIGGTDQRGVLRAIEAYVPARDSEVANPWSTLPDVPEGHSVAGAATIADTLYVAGRETATGSFAAWEFHPERDHWQPLELGPGFAPDWLAVVALQTHIYVLAGLQPEGPGPAFVAYQALYTNLIPVVTGGDAQTQPTASPQP